MLTLPKKKGEMIVLWHDFEKDAEGPVRIVLTSNGKGKWSMETQGGDPCWDDGDDVEEYEDNGESYRWTEDACIGTFQHSKEGGYQRALSRMSIDLMMSLRQHTFLTRGQKIGRPSLLEDGDNIVSKTKGKKLLVVSNLGTDFSGWPMMTIQTNKPLDADELVAALKNLALALDAFDKHYDGV